jgi:branched-chain amino acid transport system permease protein
MKSHVLQRKRSIQNQSYAADQQIFPIAQDRIAIALLLAFAALLVVPMLASDYLFRAILIPFLIISLAAVGVNILVGYCGQISLGSGAFMAVGAYGAFNFFVRIPGMPLIPALILGGVCAPPSSASCSACPACVSRACTWRWPHWRRSSSATGCSCASSGSPMIHSGSVSVSNLQVFGFEIDSPISKYLLLPGYSGGHWPAGKNLVRGAIGREWMAIRDMDVAACGDRHPPHVCQAQRLCRQLLHRRRGGCTVGLRLPRLPGSRPPSRSISLSACCSW